MKYNNDFRHDLELGQVGEKALGEIFSNKKIEVKTDLKAHQTGNVFVEYSSRGKKSGIATTEADYWCFIVSNKQVAILDTEKVKDLARKYEYSKDLQLEKLICRKYELTDAEIRLIYDEMNRLPDLGAVNNMKVEVDVNV